VTLVQSWEGLTPLSSLLFLSEPPGLILPLSSVHPGPMPPPVSPGPQAVSKYAGAEAL
jgi:hypothetical protein